MRRLLHSYQKILAAHPFLVQTTQTGILMGAGDVIAQRLIEKKNANEHDYKRTITFLGLGTCLVVRMNVHSLLSVSLKYFLIGPNTYHLVQNFERSCQRHW